MRSTPSSFSSVGMRARPATSASSFSCHTFVHPRIFRTRRTARGSVHGISWLRQSSGLEGPRNRRGAFCSKQLHCSWGVHSRYCCRDHGGDKHESMCFRDQGGDKRRQKAVYHEKPRFQLPRIYRCCTTRSVRPTALTLLILSASTFSTTIGHFLA
jgi:hypothetical protein